ncbi:hypothetical protein ACFVU0_27775 [Streptomyces sp. NPDC058122]|uniref:hypothetical protein n=1 Tax=Streptomyces sp. NPDC058122 TaxID=3346349 RepID=UPI0036E5ADB4
MKRHSLPTATAFAATTALLLTACGSGDGNPKANDKIAGVDRESTGSATPGASASDNAGRPDVALPKDLSDKFEGWSTGDAAKDAALADVRRKVDSTNYAIAGGDAELPALGVYYSGTALADAGDWVTSIVKDGYSITGVNRYYNAKIDLFDSASAGVVYCEDQSKAFAKDRKTGKVIKTAVTAKSYVLYSTRLEKNEKGV